MSDFRCPRYWWDGNNWRCQNLPNDYLSSYDFDTYCTNKSRCLECPYMDSEVRERVASWKKENEERREEPEQEQRKYEENVKDHSTTYERTTTTRTTTYSSSSSSDDGCLSAILTLLFGIISFVFTVILPFLLIYYVIPLYLGISWAGILCIFLAIQFGELELIPLTFMFAIVMAIIFYSFFPYYIITIIAKIKTKCSKIQFLKLFWKWFLKGPFAYVDLLEFLNKNNTMPKVARFISNRIEFFKKIFKKN